MSLSFGEKIKEARKAKNLTQRQLAEKIRAAHNSISDWEKDKNKPDPDTIELLCGVLEITPNYLLKTSPEDFSPSEKLLIKQYRKLDIFGQENINMAIERETERLRQIEELKKQCAPKRLLAYYGRIAAAGKSFSLEDVLSGTIEVEPTEENQNADFAIGILGDSMEPTYTGEDIVYVRKTTQISPGDVGIFQKDNCIYIKEAGNDKLISHNKNYAPISGDGITVLGKVLGKIEGEYKIIK